MSEKDYYLARGLSLVAVRAHHAATIAYVEGVLAIVAKYGISADKRKGSQFYLDLGGFVGWPLSFNEPVPDGWVRDRRDENLIRPNRSRKKDNVVGRALCKELDGLPKYPSDVGLSYDLCGEHCAWTGPVSERSSSRSIGFYRYEELGGEWVLSCFAGGRTPFDAEPLLRSTYWAMKEAEQSKAGATAAAPA